MKGHEHIEKLYKISKGHNHESLKNIANMFNKNNIHPNVSIIIIKKTINLRGFKKKKKKLTLKTNHRMNIELD
jgi:hypothetical protein